MSINTQSVIAEVTQSIIAVIVVSGGVYAILSGSQYAPVITPIMGIVLGFYFGTKSTATLLKAQQEIATKATQTTLTKGP